MINELLELFLDKCPEIFLFEGYKIQLLEGYTTTTRKDFSVTVVLASDFRFTVNVNEQQFYYLQKLDSFPTNPYYFIITNNIIEYVVRKEKIEKLQNLL